MRNGLFQNNEGISPVLGFILILAIGVTILTTAQLSFVPVWNAQEELNHLKIMQDDFKVLKSNIESSILGGTSLSSPLAMGFKYSPKMLVYNPREEAYASLEVRNSTWVEVRYNELFPEGMTDETSIKNVSTGMMIYALKGANNYDPFIYENGLIRRGSSNYTTSSQTVLANSTIFLPSVKALEYGALSGVEKKTINIYPTSQQKNSVIGKNVWLILYTDPDYVDWWETNLEKEGAAVRKKDRTKGMLIANISSSLVIKMGEAYITASPKTSPAHSPPRRLVRISSQNGVLPVDGTASIMVEVQDEYNNPVPNVPVSFSINQTKAPDNAYLNATLLQSSAVSGSDGRAGVTLKTSGAGFYYVDASFTSYTATFAFSASSQGGVMLLDYIPSGQNFLITASLKDSLGSPAAGKSVVFDKSDGFFSTQNPNTTGSDGTAGIVLNVSNATGIRVTSIRVKDTSRYSANISWDTINNVTVTAKSGYVFNSLDVPTAVDTSGCVFYGTSPGNHSTQVCDITASSHTAALNNLLSGTAYYFIVNGSRPGGSGVNSTEYMFVTEGTGDDTPPASVTGLVNVTYEPIYIRWTWTDPSDADFDHVEVLIDDASAGTVPKGTQSFNATFLMTGSGHNISIRTVDTSNNANATWVKHNATTSSIFTYLSDYTIDSGQGTVTGFGNSQSASDGGAAALFNETQLTVTPERNNYTYVSSNITINGTVTNFGNMQSNATGYANLTEEGTTGGDVTSNYVINSNFDSDNASWSYSEVDNRGYMNGRYDGTTGNTAGGSGPGSQNITYYDTSGTQPPVGTIEYARILSTSFIAPGGITAISSKFAWQATVLNIGNARYIVTYNILDNVTLSRVAEVYNSTSLNTDSLWAFYQNNTIPISTLTPGNSYNVQIELKINADRPNRPKITFLTDDIYLNITAAGSTTYNLNITTDTASVPVDTNYYLEINYSRNPGDTYSVYVWNGTEWNNRSSLNATPDTWTFINYTLNPEEYNAGNPRIRYVDNTPSGTSRGNLSIDYQRIHGYTPGIPGGWHLNIETNTSGIPASASRMLQIRYNATGDNFTLNIYNGSSFLWDGKETLNKSAMTYVEVPLSPDYLLPDGTFSPGTVSNLPRYYVLVRYTDVDENKQGRLYLDYQRVYSS